MNARKVAAFILAAACTFSTVGSVQTFAAQEQSYTAQAEAQVVDQTVRGNLVVGEGRLSGDVLIDNARITGNVIVQGDGDITLTVKNTRVKRIFIRKSSGSATIIASDGADLENVTTESATQTVIRGKAKKAEISEKISGAKLSLESAELRTIRDYGPAASIFLKDSTVREIRIDDKAENSSVDVGEGSSVRKLAIDASGAQVTGKDRIENLRGNATEKEEPQEEDIIKNVTRTSVHDPSVVDAGNGTYYIFGSHMAVSKTSDLCNWSSVTSESTDSKLFGTVGSDGSVQVTPYTDAFKKNAYTGKVKILDSEGKTVEADFGNYDIADWISDNTVQGNMWAPDVIYNKSMKKWCMYLSLNGAKWNSAIMLLTADDIEGPYVFQGPVVFTGFDKKGTKKDFSKTDLQLVTGHLDELPAKYQQISDTSKGSWGDNWPHAIDPSAYYDEDGNLRLIYGSWSGGIYDLELDENTGLRDYTVKYSSDYDTRGRAVTSDQYFGKKIAGGCYVSGEGPYIKHIGDYYYLFISYGFYSPEGGYNMRVFRSKDPTGPYVDANGNSAIFDSYIMNYDGKSTKNNRGVKLMAGYQWPTMAKGEISQGHNSVLTTKGGKSFVVYHTKFNDGTAGHEIRVHQLYTNEDGWLVAAPYEYRGETLSENGYKNDEITGNYGLIIHRFKTDYANLEILKPEDIALNADGTITGAYTGTWIEKNGTAYADITIGSKTYKGVFSKETDDGERKICFTAVSQDGECIWGCHAMTDEASVKKDIASGEIVVPQVTVKDLDLIKSLNFGSEVTYTSSDPSVLSDDGKIVKVPENPVNVTLTATVKKGYASASKDYTVTVKAPEQNDKDSLVVAKYFSNEEMDLSKVSDGSLSVANPLYKGSYNGLDLSGGVTVDFDVKRTGDVNVLGTIFAFKGAKGRLYFTPGSYLGFNNGKYYDANLTNYALVKDYIGEGGHVSVNLSQDGFTVKVNGEAAYTQDILKTAAGAGNLKNNYYEVLRSLYEEQDRLYFGAGSWWDAVANDTISNVVITVGPTTEIKDTTDTGVKADPNAIDHVGTTDRTSAFFGDWTKGYEIKDGETKTVKLTNYSNGANNWENFVLAFVNGPSEAHKLPRDQISDYLEYAVVRADAFGWGDSAYKGTFNTSWGADWTNWLSMMEDADVTIKITRDGGKLLLDFTFTGADSSVWTETGEIISTMTADSPVYFFITNEKCYNDILSVE